MALPWESVAQQISFINMLIYVGNGDFQSTGMITYRTGLRVFLEQFMLSFVPSPFNTVDK